MTRDFVTPRRLRQDVRRGALYFVSRIFTLRYQHSS